MLEINELLADSSLNKTLHDADFSPGPLGCRDGAMALLNEQIPNGGFRAEQEEIPKTFDFEYLAEDGTSFVFKFVLQETDGKRYYEMDIIQAPTYGEYSAEGRFTHRRQSPRGGEMICIGDLAKATPTIEDAKKWAGIWARLTCKYIQTGEIF